MRRETSAIELDDGLTPEETLLVAAAKATIGPGDVETARAAVGAAGFSWPRALALAGVHGVSGLLARSVERRPELSGLVPGAARDALSRARVGAAMRVERYARALAAPLASLEAEGIPVALMKGAALAATILGEGARSLNDLDLLVPDAAFDRVATVLEAHGFVAKVPATARLRRTYHEATFLRGAGLGALAVDVHWRVYPRGRAFSMPAGELFARARPVALGPLRALALSAEDTLVHYGTQLANDHLRFGFGRAADIHALVAAGIDGPRLLAVARAAGASGVTRLALGLAARLGAGARPEVLARLEAAAPGAALASEILADPRLALRPGTLRPTAVLALLPLLYTPRRSLAYALSLPWRDRGRSRALHCPPPAGATGPAASRPIVGARVAACAALIGALGAARAIGWDGLARRIAGGFDEGLPGPPRTTLARSVSRGSLATPAR